MSEDPGEEESEETHSPMLLKNINCLNGVLFWLQNSHHIEVYNNIRCQSVYDEGKCASKTTKCDGDSQYGPNNLLQYEQNVEYFLFVYLSVGGECFF